MIARRRGHRGYPGGQATVELALALPFVALLLLAAVQVLLVVRAQVLVTHAAREAARTAAVDAASDAPRDAAVDAADLDPGRLLVETSERGPPGSRVSVTVRYHFPTDVPVVGSLVADLDLQATATMRVETGTRPLVDAGTGTTGH